MSADGGFRRNWRALELSGCRRGLVVVHNIVCLTRLWPVYMALVRNNPAIVWSFTVGEDTYNRGLERHLLDRRVEVVPWTNVTDGIMQFDVALAAKYGGLEKVIAPLVVMAHGALMEKVVPVRVGAGAETPVAPYGASAEHLVRGRRVLASLRLLAHDDLLALLAEESPEVLESLRVVGDPVVDQILRGLPLRADYRAALGVGPEQRLVIVTSTCGASNLWLDEPGLTQRLVEDLPADRYQVIGMLHPDIWHTYGKQVEHILADALRLGLRLVAPDQDWPVALIAADYVVGDHGSPLHYATLTGATLLRAGFHDRLVRKGSVRERLSGLVPELLTDRPIEPQLMAASERTVRARYAGLGALLSSQPGRFATNIRREVHALLGIPEPDSPTELPPLVVPTLVTEV